MTLVICAISNTYTENTTILSIYQTGNALTPTTATGRKVKNTSTQILHSVFYHLDNIPGDSQMRTIFDQLPLSFMRVPYLSVFRQIQRGKDFERMAYYDGHYLLSGDGTEFTPRRNFLHPTAWEKRAGTARLYHQQMYAACLVKPGSKVVIPVFPEMIEANGPY